MKSRERFPEQLFPASSDPVEDGLNAGVPEEFEVP